MHKTATDTDLKITVVMPAYNAAHYLPRVLTPLLEMLAAGEVDEVLVVDDQSTDNTADAARDMGANVIVAPKNGGPGAARNLAAQVATGDILWFVDSDVIAWPGGAQRVRAAFAEPDVDAVFGSYDETPDGQQWISKYKNLTHRYHHQVANRDATTFWAGCGAVRKSAFLAVGGFDVDVYKVPSIEDIELGYRLKRAGGRILVDPELLGKHLKIWSLGNVVFTDIFRRALPWSRLMISREGLTDDLNTGVIERIRAGIAGLFAMFLFLTLIVPGVWPFTVILLATAFLINLDYFRFLVKHGGIGFGVLSMLFHQAYYIYSTLSFVWCLFEFHVLGRKNRLHVP